MMTNTTLSLVHSNQTNTTASPAIRRTEANEGGESLISNVGTSVVELAFIGFSMTIMSLIIVLGNVAVIWLYFKKTRLQQPKNFFIVSLAVADIIIGLIPVNFYTVYLMYGYWPLGVVFCNAWLVIDYWACTVSTLSLLAISYERFYFTWFPLKHRIYWNGAYVKRVILGIWVLAFLIWAPAILAYPYAIGERTVPPDQCYIQFLLENGPVTTATAFCSYYGPVLLTTIAYALVSCKLLAVRKERRIGPGTESKPTHAVAAGEASSAAPISASLTAYSEQKGNPSQFSSRPATSPALVTSNRKRRIASPSINGQSSLALSPRAACLNQTISPRLPSTKLKTEKNITTSSTSKKIDKVRQERRSRRGLKLLLLIILAFSISWLPYYLSTVVVSITKIKLPERLWRFCYIIGWGNSFLNPLCYAFGSKLFKQGLVEVFTSCFKCKSS